jgi:sugar phosphate isomerase/epimerase
MESGIVPEETHMNVSNDVPNLGRTPKDELPRIPAMSQLALHQTTTYHWSMLEDVTHCQELGIETIGLWRFKLDDFGIERSIELIKDSKLSVSSLSWAGEFTGANNTSLKEAVAETREAIDLASRLKADCLVIADGGRNGHTRNNATGLLLDALSQLCEFAEQRKVTLALQPMQPAFSIDRAFLSTTEEAIDVIRICNHPRLKLAFDVWHLWQEPNLLKRIPELVPDVAVVQLNDSPANPCSLNDRKLLGDGEIPLRDITQAFVEGGYTGAFEIALWSEEIWSRDYVQLIRDCQSRFESICRS